MSRICVFLKRLAPPESLELELFTMQHRRTTWKNHLLTSIFLLGACLLANRVAAQSKGNFRVDAPSVDAEAVEFNYHAPYPGLTKVLLYDAEGRLVWRGQYIDPEGNNKLRLRSSYLETGVAYVFHFEYKLDRVKIPVTGPPKG